VPEHAGSSGVLYNHDVLLRFPFMPPDFPDLPLVECFRAKRFRPVAAASRRN